MYVRGMNDTRGYQELFELIKYNRHVVLRETETVYRVSSVVITIGYGTRVRGVAKRFTYKFSHAYNNPLFNILNAMWRAYTVNRAEVPATIELRNTVRMLRPRKSRLISLGKRYGRLRYLSWRNN